VQKLFKSTLLLLLGALVECVMVATPAFADPFTGSPSPSLFPRFGTLVNFDDLPTGMALPSDWYRALGVLSIANIDATGHELRALGGSQSSPNYVGTGPLAEWDAIILIALAQATDMIAIGIADGMGMDTVSVLDSQMRLLEEGTAPSASSNSYIGFLRAAADIKFLRIGCDFCAIDDLQFNGAAVPASTPEPSTLLLLATGALALRKWRRTAS
jgi:hypothetical protein